MSRLRFAQAGLAGFPSFHEHLTAVVAKERRVGGSTPAGWIERFNLRPAQAYHRTRGYPEQGQEQCAKSSDAAVSALVDWHQTVSANPPQPQDRWDRLKSAA